MKKSFFILAASILFFQANAFSQKARVGAVGGATVAHMNTTIDGEKEENSSRVGVMFSMLVDMPVTGNIVFRPNLSYVQKGKKREVGSGNTASTVTDALKYAELCANFVYNAEGTSANFFVGLGPSISFNLPSKRVTEVGGAKTNADILFGKTSAEHYRGFDYGGNAVAGVTLPGGWILMINYNQGLRNLFTGTGEGEIKNAYFGVQVGRIFPNK